MNIFYPQDLFGPGSRVVGCQTVKGSFLGPVLFFFLRLLVGLGTKDSLTEVPCQNSCQI